MRVTAKQIVLEVLSAHVAGPEAVPVRLLVRAAEVFGIAENSVRVSVARLCAEDRLESPERGVYRLGTAARPLHERVASWRNLEALCTPWGGAFIGAHTAGLPRTDRANIRGRERALSLWGFRTLSPGLEIRPANLGVGMDSLRDGLVRLGLEASAPVFRMDDLGELDARARSLWDGSALERTYRETVATLEESEARLGSLPLEEAVRESFLLGREAIRVLVTDPLLPEPLVRVRDRQKLVETMRRYDVEGHALWRRLLLENLETDSARSEVGSA